MATRLLALGALLSANAVATAAPLISPPPPAEPPVVYTARKGDNLYNLALHYMHRLSDYRIVQMLNHVRDPRRIPIGTRLLIPRPLLKSDPLQARIIAFRGAATIDGRGATIGANVGEGGRLQTGVNAFLSISLADGSTITLPSQSVIRVERLRRFKLTGEMERLFKLENGRSQTEVTPRTNGRDRFEMRTPISVAAVRGTDFRVAFLDGGKAATAEVLGGHVGLDAGGAETNLDPGLGARISESGTSGPIKLLPAPTLIDPARDQTGALLTFRIVPLEGAVRYRAQIARDAGFLDIAEEAWSDSMVATLPSLPNGDYFVRISAIDPNELEGFPRVYGFERYLNTLSLSAEMLPGGRRYLFRWRDEGEGARIYRFAIARADAPGAPVIDEPGLTSHEFVATDLPPGDYVWRVLSSSSSGGKIHATWSSPQTLTVAGQARGPATPKRAKPPAS